MPAIAKLSDDLLSKILCLAADTDVYAKFSLAQVSAHWRKVALNSPQLWTDIHISSWSYTSARVPLTLVLERAGPSALLHIELLGSFLMRDALYLATTLAPYAARMRVLQTPDEHFDALLTSGLHYPALEVLRVRGVRPDRNRAPTILLAAPNLRVLQLDSLRLPSGVDELFSERIEEVIIRQCDGIKVTHLLAILARCVHLVQLTYAVDLTPAHREAVTGDVVPLRHLTTLRLIFPFPEILDLLDCAVDRSTDLPMLMISSDCNGEPDGVRRLCEAVSRGLGQLVSLKLNDEFSTSFRDDAGLTRYMQVLNVPKHAWAHVWPHFSQKHSAHTCVEELQIPFRYWNDFTESFGRYPPGPSLCTLRLLVSGNDFKCTVSDLPPLRPLVLPGLERIEFRSSGRSYPAVGVVYALWSISSGHDARPIAVSVRGLSQSLEYLQELMQQGHTGGTWNLLGASE